MYLHIGNGESVRDKDVIGVFDLDTATVSKITKKFINEKQRAGRVEYTDTDLPRSFVVIGNKTDSHIKLSRISTVGLKQRAENELKNITE